MRGSNPRPPACKAGALPTELTTHKNKTVHFCYPTSWANRKINGLQCWDRTNDTQFVYFAVTVLKIGAQGGIWTHTVSHLILSQAPLPFRHSGIKSRHWTLFVSTDTKSVLSNLPAGANFKLALLPLYHKWSLLLFSAFVYILYHIFYKMSN